MDLKYLQVTKGYTLKYNLYREISFIILIKLFLNRFVLMNTIFIIFKPTLRTYAGASIKTWQEKRNSPNNHSQSEHNVFFWAETIQNEAYHVRFGNPVEWLFEFGR